jgi:hypothetical protein
MSAEAKTLQQVVTLFGPNATDELVQNPEFYAEVAKYSKVVVKYQVLNLDDASLYIQTAKVKDKKYWRSTKTISAVGDDSVILTRDAGLTSEYLENWLRWRVAASGANWRVTFSIQLFCK